MNRLGLARKLDDPLCAAVLAAGWEPVPVFATRTEATGTPPPPGPADAVLVLSPSAARLGRIPVDALCLAQGEATARALGDRASLVSREARAEELFELLCERFPQGGTFLLARGERSREHLERVAAGTRWRLVPWITHRETAADPAPDLAGLTAVLALSPLQAELLGPRSAGLLRFAWGQRTRLAFEAVGYPVDDWCRPEAAALQQLLSFHSRS